MTRRAAAVVPATGGAYGVRYREGRLWLGSWVSVCTADGRATFDLKTAQLYADQALQNGVVPSRSYAGVEPILTLDEEITP